MVKALHYGGLKVTHLKFDAQNRTVHIGNGITIGVNSIKELTAQNGSISIVKIDHSKSSSHNTAIKVHLKDMGLHFTVKLEGEHWDLWWHSSVKWKNSHGLIGELTILGERVHAIAL